MDWRRWVLGVWLLSSGAVPVFAQERWTHRHWSGQSWGEPAQLDEWISERGYVRHLRFRDFPFQEWTVLDGAGEAWEIDCNGRRRKLQGGALQDLQVRWQLESGRWRGSVGKSGTWTPFPGKSVELELDERGQLSQARFSNQSLRWTGGSTLLEQSSSLRQPSRYQLAGQDQEPPHPPEPEPAPARPDAELPLSLIAERWTQLAVELEGQPGIFLVDTGASNTVLDVGWARSLGLPLAGKQSLQAGLFSSIQWARCGSLKIAGQEFGPQTVLALDIQNGAFGQAFPGVRGILGYDFLADFIVQIDYPRSRLRLIAPDRFQPRADDVAVACQRQGPGLSMTVTVGDAAGNFTLDTGNGGTVLVQHLPGQNGLVTDSLREYYDPKGAQFGSGGAGSWPGRGPVRVGPFLWPEAPLEVVDEASASGASLESAGNIGVGFLRHFRVTLDLSGSRLWLAQELPFAPAWRATYGFQLEQTEGRWLIKNLKQPALKAGLQELDEVLLVNGLAPQGLPTDAFLAQARPGQRLSLRLRRQGQEWDVELSAQGLDP